MDRQTESRLGRAARGALFALIVAAPAAGGGTHPAVLPVFAVLALVAASLSILDGVRSRSQLAVPGVSLGLFAFALLTLGQAVPLPPWIHRALAPTTHDALAFALDAEGWWPLTYEPAATLAEAAKLALYGVTSMVAFRCARARGAGRAALVPVITAGLVVIVIALAHAFLEEDRFFGVLPARGSTSATLTTFVNPNHASGFMMLVAMSAIGLALDSPLRARRAAFGAISLAAILVSLAELSRGGILAFAVAALIFFFAARAGAGVRPRVVATAFVFPLLLDGLPTRARALVSGAGVEEKLAAIADALPMIADHALTGIGRGAYVSVYPRYKTSTLQLTFAYPENLVVQLLSEWGVLVGAAALAGLVALLALAIARRRSLAVAGAIAGVVGLFAHNLVDFSLELPGVAIPVAAILGAAAAEDGVRRRARFGAAAPLALALLLAILTWLAVSRRGVYEDLADLEAAAGGSSRLGLEEARGLAAAHPANPAAALFASYLHEVAGEPDRRRAVRYANRALYFGPTYADAHLAIGRLLLSADRRKQGLVEVRRAWELAGPGGYARVIDDVALRVRSADELLLAVPRSDAELDLLDARALLLALGRLLSRPATHPLAATIARSLDLGSLSREELLMAAQLARSAGDLVTAEAALVDLRARAPADAEAALALARFLEGQGDRAGAERIAKEHAGREGADAQPFLDLLLRVAIHARDEEGARDALRRMKEGSSFLQDRRGELARAEARFEARFGRHARAIRALDEAVRLAPEDLDLRLERAELFKRSGRLEEARADLRFVLARRPDHPARSQLDSLPPPGPGTSAGNH